MLQSVVRNSISSSSYSGGQTKSPMTGDLSLYGRHPGDEQFTRNFIWQGTPVLGDLPACRENRKNHLDAVAEFRGNSDQEDDLTLMIVKILN